jgi:hypothetical protein
MTAGINSVARGGVAVGSRRHRRSTNEKTWNITHPVNSHPK